VGGVFRFLKAILNFLWVVLRPLGKLDTTFGWVDVMLLIAQFAYYVAFGVIYNSASTQKDIFSWFQAHSLWFIIGLPLMLLLIAGIKLQFRIGEYEDKNPVIVFGDGVIAKAVAKDLNDSNILGDTRLFNIFIKNDPPKNNRSDIKTASKVVSIVDIYATDNLKTPFLSYFGKWRDTPQYNPVTHKEALAQLMELDELPPNGLPRHLDFAIKHFTDEDIYGYNDEAHKYAKGGRYERFKLPFKRILVCIRIKAVNLRGEPASWYEIENKGSNVEPTIRHLSLAEIKGLIKAQPVKSP
jgi:hypothetical protein